MKTKVRTPQKDAVKKLSELYYKRREEALKKAQDIAGKEKKKNRNERAAASQLKRSSDMEI